MPRPHHVAASALAAALLAGTAATTLAQSAPAAGTAAPKAKAPAAPATPAASAPARFAVNHGLCKDFLALAPDLRGMVVAWTAGRYHKLDRWVLDEPTARKVVAGVEQACEKAPEGLFRYKVVGEIDKLK